MPHSMTVAQFAAAANSAAGNNRLVTRLWNVADHTPIPEVFWSILTCYCASSFDDPRDPNTIRFTY